MDDGIVINKKRAQSNISRSVLRSIEFNNKVDKILQSMTRKEIYEEASAHEERTIPLTLPRVYAQVLEEMAEEHGVKAYSDVIVTLIMIGSRSFNEKTSPMDIVTKIL